MVGASYSDLPVHIPISPPTLGVNGGTVPSRCALLRGAASSANTTTKVFAAVWIVLFDQILKNLMSVARVSGRLGRRDSAISWG